MFKKLLKDYLLFQSINQVDLAKILGVTQQSVNEFLSSDGKPHKKTREKYFDTIEGFKDFYSHNIGGGQGINPIKKVDVDQSDIDYLDNISDIHILEYLYRNSERFKKSSLCKKVFDSMYIDDYIQDIKAELKKVK